MIDRRKFLTFVPAVAATFGGIAGLTAPGAEAKSQTQGLGAIETLMRGHGLLWRAIIAYDVIRDRILKKQETDPSLVLDTASVIHTYLEDFHEKAEEKYIFAPLEKDSAQSPAIQELKIQHGTGYELTRRISNLAKTGKMDAELAGYLDAFQRMYRHHAAYEDTIIFPAFDQLKKHTDMAELAETFAAEEKKVLGNSGFEVFLNQIAHVEKQLGIYELSTSTAKLP